MKSFLLSLTFLWANLDALESPQANMNIFITSFSSMLSQRFTQELTPLIVKYGKRIPAENLQNLLYHVAQKSPGQIRSLCMTLNTHLDSSTTISTLVTHQSNCITPTTFHKLCTDGHYTAATQLVEFLEIPVLTQSCFSFTPYMTLASKHIETNPTQTLDLVTLLTTIIQHMGKTQAKQALRARQTLHINKGPTAFSLAFKNGNPAMAETLLPYVDHEELVDGWFGNPLNHAAAVKQSGIEWQDNAWISFTQAILERLRTIQDPFENTPPDFLLNYALAHQESRQKRTALHNALIRENKTIAILLITAGSGESLILRDECGSTPWTLVTKNRWKDTDAQARVVSVLQEKIESCTKLSAQDKKDFFNSAHEKNSCVQRQKTLADFLYTLE